MGSGWDVGMNEVGKVFEAFYFMGDVRVKVMAGCKDCQVRTGGVKVERVACRVGSACGRGAEWTMLQV